MFCSCIHFTGVQNAIPLSHPVQQQHHNHLKQGLEGLLAALTWLGMSRDGNPTDLVVWRAEAPNIMVWEMKHWGEGRTATLLSWHSHHWNECWHLPHTDNGSTLEVHKACWRGLHYRAANPLKMSVTSEHRHCLLGIGWFRIEEHLTPKLVFSAAYTGGLRSSAKFSVKLIASINTKELILQTLQQNIVYNKSKQGLFTL